MRPRLTIVALTTLALVVLNSMVLLDPTPTRAAGATQIAGLSVYATEAQCPDVGELGADAALILTGDLAGCWYIFIETSVCSPSGTYRETGHELFVGQYNGTDGSFETTYRFEAKFEDCDPSRELFGRCQHPIVEGSGTGVFAGVDGRLNFKDDIAAGNFPYRGHLQWSSRGLSQQLLRATTAC